MCFASAAEWQMLNDSTERLPSADDSSPLETPAVAYDTHATPSGVWKDVRLHPHVRARVQCIELHARKPRDHPVLHASMHPCTPALASRGLCVGLFAPTSMGWGFWEMKRGSQFEPHTRNPLRDRITIYLPAFGVSQVPPGDLRMYGTCAGDFISS